MQFLPSQSSWHDAKPGHIGGRNLQLGLAHFLAVLMPCVAMASLGCHIPLMQPGLDEVREWARTDPSQVGLKHLLQPAAHVDALLIRGQRILQVADEVVGLAEVEGHPGVARLPRLLLLQQAQVQLQSVSCSALLTCF